MSISDRVCPSCRKPIGLYEAAGIYVPLEAFAVERIMKSELEKSQNPFIPIGMTSKSEWFKIHLSSTCKHCGHISLWRASKSDLETLLNGNTASSEFGFWQSYEPAVLKRIFENADDENIKSAVCDLIQDATKSRVE